ncbi:hypothetical protein AB1N83_001864 [Pleurotus pulmonarius]
MFTTAQTHPFVFVKNSGSEETISKFAEHCSFATEESLAESPQIVTRPALATPPIHLTDFIAILLRCCNVSLSVAETTLAVINWMTEDGIKCPFVSSTPHHLFLATYQAILRAATNKADIEYKPSQNTSYVMHADDITSMRLEVEEYLSTLNDRQWAFLRILACRDIAGTMEELEALEAEDLWYSAGGRRSWEGFKVLTTANVYEEEPSTETIPPIPHTAPVHPTTVSIHSTPDVHEPWPAKKVSITSRVWRRLRRATGFGVANKS